jgi:hypothetical protein
MTGKLLILRVSTPSIVGGAPYRKADLVIKEDFKRVTSRMTGMGLRVMPLYEATKQPILYEWQKLANRGVGERQFDGFDTPGNPKNNAWANGKTVEKSPPPDDLLFLRDHPHVKFSIQQGARNRLYVSSESGLKAGVFPTEFESVVLTKEGERPSRWLLAEEFDSLFLEGDLSFHPRVLLGRCYYFSVEDKEHVAAAWCVYLMAATRLQAQGNDNGGDAHQLPIMAPQFVQCVVLVLIAYFRFVFPSPHDPPLLLPTVGPNRTGTTAYACFSPGASFTIRTGFWSASNRLHLCLLNCIFMSVSASSSRGCLEWNCILHASHTPMAMGVSFTILRLRILGMFGLFFTAMAVRTGSEKRVSDIIHAGYEVCSISATDTGCRSTRDLIIDSNERRDRITRGRLRPSCQ